MHRPRLPLIALALLLGFTALPAGAAPSGLPAGTARYLVQLAADPLATYDGGLAGLPATDPNTIARQAAARAAAAGKGRELSAAELAALPTVYGDARLDLASPAARAYARHLRAAQDQALARIQRLAPAARALYHYGVVFNGLTLRLTPGQAAAVRALPGVVAVTAEEPVELRMDVTPGIIHAVEAWEDPRIGRREDAGRGLRIAIIDSGVAVDHPMFDDRGYTAPTGYPKATKRVGDQVDSYPPDEVGDYANNKLIAARIYLNPEIAGRVTGDDTPYPAATHGSHVAGIAGGNLVRGAPNDFGTGNLELSGVAPAAYLMAYRFDYAYTPEMVAAIEDAVADKADVINNSWGTALMNVVQADAHPVAQAFKAAAAANVIVVAAAGNSGGVGPASLGGPHQMIDEVITVANTQTGRGFHHRLEAEGQGLAENLKVHRDPVVASYGTQPFDVVESPAYAKPVCGETNNDGAADQLVLVDFAHACRTNVVELNPQVAPLLGPWAQQVAGAARAGAAGIVFHATDANQVGNSFNNWLVLRYYYGALLPEELREPPLTLLIVGADAKALGQWAGGHADLRLRFDITPESETNAALLDMASASTSQGPAPAGLKLKPDIAAPGTDVLSSVIGGGYATLSGTSMASPVIAGAAAVVRQAWPAWSPAEVKAALMTTADPVVKAAGQAGATAPVTVQGAGRVNLARAIDPGLLVTPPSLNLGFGGGTPAFTLTARDLRRGGGGPLTYRLSVEPGAGGAALSPVMPAELTVPAGGQVEVPLLFEMGPLAAGYYDGHIVLTGGGKTVRVNYAGWVLGETKDVLLINNRANLVVQPNGSAGYADSPDYSAFWIEALEGAELSYDTWTIAPDARRTLPPLAELMRYRLVILAAGDSNVPLEGYGGASATMTPLQMYLLGGGTMLASGARWPTMVTFNNNQAAGSTHMLSRYFAGFHQTDNDVAPPGAFTAARLFSRPVKLSDGGSAEAADNGQVVDLGRPMDAVDTRPRNQGEPRAPDNSWTHLAIDQVLPYMKSYLQTADGKSAMTGVTADATLEDPLPASGVPWRALFAAFPVEAVLGDATHLSRAQLLRQAFDWATEPRPTLAVSATGPFAPGTEGRVAVEVQAPASFSGAVSYRWDAGDGRALLRTEAPSLPLVYAQAGRYTVRVEVTSRLGHTYVGGGSVLVEEAVRPPAPVLLPILYRDATAR